MQEKLCSVSKNQRLSFHVTARTIDDQYFKRPMKYVWEDCIKRICESHRMSNVDVMSFVLMNNHYHLLLKCDQRSLEKFMTQFTPEYLKNFKFEVIRSPKYLLHAYKYIYQNPIRANIAKRVQDYPYSMIHHLNKGKQFDFPVIDKYGVVDEYKLYWLNK